MNSPIAVHFKVVPPRTRNIAITSSTCVLEQDNWNDYRFRTTYHLSLHVLSPSGAVEITALGEVKILRKGQTKEDGLQINSDFDQLPSIFCSVGQNLDYYERIRELGDVGRAVLAALQDVVANPKLVAAFESEAGWATSLFRDQKDRGESFRSLARGLVDGNYHKAPQDQQSFEFHATGWRQSVTFDTTSGEPWDSDGPVLPERINVLVGRNGSGKSTLLARLARVAYGSPSERAVSPLSDLGVLSPEGVGFPRVLTVSFSPFDSFRIPGSDDRNRIQIAKDLQRGIGRFSFIGLRNLTAEFDASDLETDLREAGALTTVDDRVAHTKLKSIEELASEFEAYCVRITEKAREPILKNSLLKLEKGLFGDDDLMSVMRQLDRKARNWFLDCSTGHKITLLVTFGVAACIESHSLVLIDEPETHLHPPLLAAMMHGLRVLLERFESIAVVATHSPVVVQESMARHVHVVRREGDVTDVSPVRSETFGESIGQITAQVFGMESNATDFHRILDALIERYKTISEIENLFLDGTMSHQAMAYVMARLASIKRA